MKASPKVKICGMTRKKDLLCAKALGADYFGFILYEKSPRFISLDTLKDIIGTISLNSCVFVDVMPTEDKIKQMQDLGCQNFQIHTHEGISFDQYDTYARLIKKEALWLAPQLKNLNNFDQALFELADTFLIDSYSKSQIGGTGKIGDWDQFKHLRSQYPNKKWILAGGLNPDNIKDAIEQSQTELLDVNSGVEEAPGIKSEEALKRLFRNIQS